MKCLTERAIELMWPGVPVTACASNCPAGLNTPAERSPASRTTVENATRIMVRACSSTTAISRSHITWLRIFWKSLFMMPAASYVSLQNEVAVRGDLAFEGRRHEGRRLVLDDHGRPRERGADLHGVAPDDRRGDELANLAIEYRLGALDRCGADRAGRLRWLGCFVLALADQHQHPGQRLDTEVRDR